MFYKVLVIGAAGIDYNSYVNSYPKEDEKVRSLSHIICGGGNAANTSVALQRLGIQTSLISKWGNDPNGILIQTELENEGINVSYCDSSSPISAFTYILITKSNQTRTCIHTPLPNDLTINHVNEILKSINLLDYKLIHFDSRHTEISLYLSNIITEFNIPISLDAERDRPPHFEKLLLNTTYLFTNQFFCKNFIDSRDDLSTFLTNYQIKCQSIVIKDKNEEEIEDNDLNVMLRLYSYLLEKESKIKVLVTTLGSNGCVLLTTSLNQSSNQPNNPNNQFNELDKLLNKLPVDTKYLSIYINNVIKFQAIRMSSISIPSSEVVDTTGAGDGFIGGCLAGIANGFSFENCLRLGTLVANRKIRIEGTRKGLPTISDLLNHLSDH